MNKDFWKNKKVLITGNTGFKGAWLSQILLNCGAEVYGYALENSEPKSIFNAIKLGNRMETCIGDICDENRLNEFVLKVKPQIVFHLAAQPIVLDSYKKPLYTFQTNAIGTATLFEAVRNVQTVKAVVNITTDKVYENNDNHEPFMEDDKLGGYDPYSASKACSEIVTSSFIFSFFNPQKYGDTHSTAIATARAGNVIGGGDFAPERLIPDCVRAVYNNDYITLRNPAYIRPWQNVLEPLALYVMLAEKLYTDGTEYGGAWNVGPQIKDCLSVLEVMKKFQQHIPQLKYKAANINANKVHEAQLLMLNSDKIKNKLGFTNHWNIDDAVKYTALWYKAQMDNEDMTDVTDKIISEYFSV